MKKILLVIYVLLAGQPLPINASPLAFFAALAGSQAASFLSEADRFISAHLPESIRLRPDVLEKCYKAKDDTGIARIKPVIFMYMPDGNSETPAGLALSPHPTFGIVKLNQDVLDEHDRYPSSINNTIHAIYHECGHIYHAHGTPFSLLRHFSALTPLCLALHDYSRGVVVATSALSILELLVNEISKLNDSKIVRKDEYQADYTAYKAMATHNTAPLKEKLRPLIQLSKNGNGNKRPGRGDKYPTHDESIALIYSALKKASKHQQFENDPNIQTIINKQDVLNGITQVLGKEYEI